MISVSCDICKKKMDNPMSGRDYFYYADRSICEPCKDGLESHIKPTVRTRAPYAIDWYDKLLRDSLDKAVQKGRI